MKTLLKYILRLFIFWILLFAVQRTVFLIYNQTELLNVSWKDIFLSYWHGLAMDIAAFAFVSTLPLLFCIINLFVRRKIWAKLSNIFTLLFVTISLIIGILDTSLYSNWGSKLNAKAFSYALFPGESIKAFNAVPVWIFVIILLAEIALAFFIYLKWIKLRVPEKSSIWLSSLVGLIILAALPFGYRGGFQKYPLSRNLVYYSKHRVLNYAALNGPWNTMDILLKSKRQTNPYTYFDSKKAISIVKKMHLSLCDSTLQILNTQRPNIVLILMEGATAENMQTLGGMEKITPGLDSLTKEGLLFTHFYATGFRTEQGIISYLSTFPAQPTTTIMREFGKFEKLPNLGRVMDDNGYGCNYYFSGDLDFANTEAYLNSSSFSKILGHDSRPWKKCTEWGAWDEELFDCHLAEAGMDKQPFFSMIMTSTSHEPFDAPVITKFNAKDECSRYKNTICYLDRCLFNYIEKAKKTSWYNNTLFVITSDHAHYYPMNRGKIEPERYHIPLLMLGGALKPEWRGKSIDQIGSQLDLAATLLAQLKISGNQFVRSKNMLNPCQPAFAFYVFDNGFGMITPEQTLIYDHDLGKVVYKEKNIPADKDYKILEMGKAYLQVMYEEYLNLNR
jgi:phosphoglycerol transferase MdoB-like AlkP superfamily enzyme